MTSGGTEALFCAIQAVVRPGDEVILLEPAYDSYEPAVRSRGAAPCACRCGPRIRRRLGPGRDAVSPRTRLVIVNSPHNPSGAVWAPGGSRRARPDLLRPTAARAVGRGLRAHGVRRAVTRERARRRELAARSFVVSSFGKTYHATGWKVGYCVAPACAHRGIPQGAPVRAVRGRHTDPGRSRGLPGRVPRAPPRTAGLLPGEARPLLPPARRHAAAVHALGGNLLPARGLLRGERAPRRGVRTLAHARDRRRGHPCFSIFHACRTTRVVRFCFAKSEATLDAAGDRLRRLGS